MILSDLQMPVITGMALHAKLESIAPDQARRMIFLTGVAASSGALEFLAGTENTVVEKPFDARELLRFVSESVG